MRLFARSAALLAVLFTAASVSSHADSFSYSFSDTTDAPNQIFFTYVSPTLITTTTTFVPLTCMVESTPCINVTFTFDPTSTVDPAEISLQGSKTGVSDFFNSTAFLTTLGTNTAFNGHVTLTITDLSTTPSVPEPSTIALFGTGVLGLAGIARRKFLRA